MGLLIFYFSYMYNLFGIIFFLSYKYTCKSVFIRYIYLLFLFRNGKKKFNYGGENNKDGIFSWMKE